MTRLYWTDFDTSQSDNLQGEGYPLSAVVTVQLMRANPEAVYEVSGYDQCVVLPASDATSDGLWIGPHPVPVRYDRDGLPRAIGVTPLCSGGSGERTLRCVYMDAFRDIVTSDYDSATDPAAEWTVAADTENTWQTEATITPPRRMSFPAWGGLRNAPSGVASADYTTLTRYGFVLFKWDADSSAPTFAGFRVREMVSV